MLLHFFPSVCEEYYVAGLKIVDKRELKLLYRGAAPARKSSNAAARGAGGNQPPAPQA